MCPLPQKRVCFVGETSGFFPYLGRENLFSWTDANKMPALSAKNAKTRRSVWEKSGGKSPHLVMDLLLVLGWETNLLSWGEKFSLKCLTFSDNVIFLGQPGRSPCRRKLRWISNFGSKQPEIVAAPASFFPMVVTNLIVPLFSRRRCQQNCILKLESLLFLSHFL